MIYVKIDGKWERVSHWQPCNGFDEPGALYEGMILWQKGQTQSMAKREEWMYEKDYKAMWELGRLKTA